MAIIDTTKIDPNLTSTAGTADIDQLKKALGTDSLAPTTVAEAGGTPDQAAHANDSTMNHTAGGGMANVTVGSSQQGQQATTSKFMEGLGGTVAMSTNLVDRLRNNVNNAITAKGNEQSKLAFSTTGLDKNVLIPADKLDAVTNIIKTPDMAFEDRLVALQNLGLDAVTAKKILETQMNTSFNEGLSSYADLGVKTSVADLIGTDNKDPSLDVNTIANTLGLSVDVINKMSVFELQDTINRMRENERANVNAAVSEEVLRSPDITTKEAANVVDDRFTTGTLAGLKKETDGVIEKDTMTLNIDGEDVEIDISDLLGIEGLAKEIKEFQDTKDIIGLPKPILDAINSNSTNYANLVNADLKVADALISNQDKLRQFFSNGAEGNIEKVLGEDINANMNAKGISGFYDKLNTVSGKDVIGKLKPELADLDTKYSNYTKYDPALQELINQYNVLATKKGGELDWQGLDAKLNTMNLNQDNVGKYKLADDIDLNDDGKFSADELTALKNKDINAFNSLNNDTFMKRLLDADLGSIKSNDDIAAEKKAISDKNIALGQQRVSYGDKGRELRNSINTQFDKLSSYDPNASDQFRNKYGSLLSKFDSAMAGNDFTLADSVLKEINALQTEIDDVTNRTSDNYTDQQRSDGSYVTKQEWSNAGTSKEAKQISKLYGDSSNEMHRYLHLVTAAGLSPSDAVRGVLSEQGQSKEAINNTLTNISDSKKNYFWR